MNKLFTERVRENVLEQLRNICIAHRLEDNALASYYKNFVRWIGIFHLDFTVNEENKEMNQFIREGKNRFDFSVYLNGSSNEWIKQYGSYSDTNINIEYSQKDNGDMNWSGDQFLTKIWKEVFAQKQGEVYSNVDTIIQDLVYIYFHNRVFSLLVDDCNVLFPKYGKTNSYESYLRKKYDCWNGVILELKKCYKRYDTWQGVEYLQYALVYSYKKMNDLCRALGVKEKMDVTRLVKASQCIYKLDAEFYIIEYLKAGIMQNDFMQSGISKYYIKQCINKCEIDVVKSYLYYCLGKIYEEEKAFDVACKSYEKSYNKNKNNFRALYKVAILKKTQGKYSEAIVLFRKILEILQVQELGKRENLKYLGLVELEYVCKCYVLIGRMENLVNAISYYDEVEEISNQLKENEILKNAYDITERAMIYQNLKNVLNINYIDNKIAYSQSLRNYKRWGKRYGRKS